MTITTIKKDRDKGRNYDYDRDYSNKGEEIIAASSESSVLLEKFFEDYENPFYPSLTAIVKTEEEADKIIEKISNFSTEKKGKSFITSGKTSMSNYIANVLNQETIDKYKDKLQPFRDIQGYLDESMKIEIPDVVKGKYFSIDILLEARNNSYIYTKFALRVNLTQKDIGFLGKDVLKSSNPEIIVNAIVKSFWNDDEINPVYDMGYKVDTKLKISGVVKLFDGTYMFLPKGKELDKRKGFIEKFQEKGRFPDKTLILIDPVREAIVQSNTVGDIVNISIKGATRPSNEDYKKLFDKTLGEGITLKNKPSSVMNIWNISNFYTKEDADYVVENIDKPLHELQANGTLLPFVRRLKAIYTEKREQVIPTTYLSVMGTVQAIIQEVKNYDKIAKAVVDKRKAFNTVTGKDAGSVTSMRSNFVFLPHQGEAYAKMGAAGDTAILDASTGAGKCAEGWCCVPTTKGLITLKECWNNSDPAIDVNGFRSTEFDTYTTKGINYVDKTYKTKGDIKRLYFSDGDFIGGLPEHKLIALENNNLKFKRLNELTVGDYLPKTYDTNVYSNIVPILDTPIGKKELTTEFAELLGLIVAEGHVLEKFNMFSITVKSNSFKEYILELTKSFFGEELFSCSKDKNNLNFMALGKGMQEYRDFIKSIVDPGLSQDRNIPYVIRTAPKEYQCAFLSGLFEGDASIYGEDRRFIEYTSISRMLSLQIKYMLENMGILSEIKWGDAYKTEFSGIKTKRVYRLFIANIHYKKFHNEIGFISPRKVKKLQDCINHYDWLAENAVQNTNFKVHGWFNKVPAGNIANETLDKVKEIAGTINFEVEVIQANHTVRSFRSFPYTLTKLFDNIGINLIKINNNIITKYGIENIINLVDKAPAKVKHALLLNHTISKNLKILKKLNSKVWVKVDRESYKENVDCYDLSVPGPHSYAINGVMGHNTLMLMTDMLRLMHAKKVFRPLVVVPNSLVGQWIGEISFFTKGAINAIAVTTETVNNWGDEEIEKLCREAPRNSIFITTYSFLTNKAEEGPWEGYEFPQVDWIKDIIHPDWISLDECFFGDTQVLIDYDKAVSIEDIYNNPSITHVLSYDLKKKKIVKKKIVKKLRYKIKDSDTFIPLRVYDEEKDIEAFQYMTNNHQIFLKDGTEKAAKDIKVNDELITYNGEYKVYKTCKYCDELVEKTKSAYNSHIQSVHKDIAGPGAIVQCPECGININRGGLHSPRLYKHQYTGEKEYTENIDRLTSNWKKFRNSKEGEQTFKGSSERITTDNHYVNVLKGHDIGGGCSRRSKTDEYKYDLNILGSHNYFAVFKDRDTGSYENGVPILVHNSHLVKNPGSLRSQACLGFRDSAFRRIATGTLISNTPSDLVGQTAFLDPGIMGTPEEFGSRYGYGVNRYGKVSDWKPNAEEMIRNDLQESSFLLSYREKDWASMLPEIEYKKHLVELTVNQKKVYKVMVEEIIAEIMDDPTLKRQWLEFKDSGGESDETMSMQLLGKLAKLEQFLTAPDRSAFVKYKLPESDRVSPKMNIIDDLIEKSIKDGYKCIVGVHFKLSAAHLLNNSRFKNKGIYYDASHKENLIKFMKDKNIRVMFALVQCFDGDTYVMIDHDKAMMIKDIYSNENITHLLSYDLDKKEIVKKKINYKSRQDATNDTFYSLSIKKPGSTKWHTVKVTGNHQIWSHSRKAYIKVRDLKKGEKVVTYNGDFEYYKSCNKCGEIVGSNRQDQNTHNNSHRLGLDYDEQYGKKKSKQIRDQISETVKEIVDNPVTGLTWDEYYGKKKSIEMKKTTSESSSRSWEERMGKNKANKLKKVASKRTKGISDIERFGKKKAKNKSEIISKSMTKRQLGKSWEEQFGKEKELEKKDKLRITARKNGLKAWVEPNKPEQNIIDLEIDNVYFVGNGSYFVNLGKYKQRKRCQKCFKTGISNCRLPEQTNNWIKNPDFVWVDGATCSKCLYHKEYKACMFRADKKACKEFIPKNTVKVDGVIEVDGDYWHCDKEIKARNRLYKKKGLKVISINPNICYTDKDLNKVKGKLESFANNHISEVLDIRKASIKRDFKYTFEVADTHNYFVVGRKERSNDPNDGIPFLVSNSIKEGLNLQLANRIIIVDQDWTPGGTKQLIGRIFRPSLVIDPKTKKMVNVNMGKTVYIDTVLANKSADVLKYAYLTWKKLFNARVMEKSPIVPGMKVALSEENFTADIRSVGGAELLTKDTQYQEWLDKEINEERKLKKELIAPKHTKPIPGKKINTPWVIGMPLPDVVKGTSVVDYLENKDLDDEDLRWHREILVNKIVKTEFGEGKIVGVYKGSVRVRDADGESYSSNMRTTIILDKTTLDVKKVLEETDISKMVEDDTVSISMVLYNDIPSLEAELDDPDSKSLKKVGFVYQGPYFYIQVKNKNWGKDLLDKLSKKYIISKVHYKNCMEIIAQMNRSKYKYEVPDIKMFQKIRHIKAKPKQLKIYPLVEDEIVYLVVDKFTHPKIQLTRYLFDKIDGYWYFFGGTKAKIVQALKNIKRIGITIDSYPDLREEALGFEIKLPKKI